MKRLQWAFPAVLIVALGIAITARIGRGGARHSGSKPESSSEAPSAFKVADNHWRVTKQARDRYLTDLERVNRDIQLRPKR